MKTTIAWMLIAATGILATNVKADVTAFLSSRAGEKSFWVRVNQPARPGGKAFISYHQGSDVVATGRIFWVSTAAPYDALITDVSMSKTVSSVRRFTVYERFLEGKGIATVDYLDAITPGMAVRLQTLESAPASPTGTTTDFGEFAARPEGKSLIERNKIASPKSLAQWLRSNTDTRFKDPVTARLAWRICQADRSAGNIGGLAPEGFFPPDLAKAKPASANPERP